jgi:hypothetical protein
MTNCPFRKFQGVTGFKRLQPYCDYMHNRLGCPVIDINTGESIDCGDLDENQLKAARKERKRLGGIA